MSDLISRSALDSFFYSETSGTDEIIEDAVMKYSEMEMEFSDDCRALCKDIIEMCRNVIRTEQTVEAKPVVHCKDCIWWEDEHVLLSDGTKRPYTEEEKKNCPTGVTCDIGINVGSRCMVNPHITNLFRNADDYCSRADMRKKV